LSHCPAAIDRAFHEDYRNGRAKVGHKEQNPLNYMISKGFSSIVPEYPAAKPCTIAVQQPAFAAQQ